MAGEVKGKVYEAITRVALELAIEKSRKGWRVLWHEQPDWVTIEADLAVGKSANEVEALLMVTHSTSESVSHKKFWRNIAEFFQWKVQGPKPVRCYSVVFDAKIKPALKKISDAIVDGVVEVADVKYGKQLIKYVQKNQKKFGNSDQRRYEYTKRLVDPEDDVYDENIAESVGELAQDIKLKLDAENRDAGPLWAILRKVDKRTYTVPSTKNTYVRNGIARLMIFDNAVRPLVYDAVGSGSNIEDDAVPQYAIDLNLVTEDLSGVKIDDADIVSTVKLLGRDGCELLVKSIPKRMHDFIDPLRAVGNLDLYSKFVVDHYDELQTAKGMEKWLKACYDDPAGMLDGYGDMDIEPRDTWLFIYCMTLEKAEQGQILAYGLSNLAADTGYPEIGSGGFVIPPFVYRQKTIPSEMLKAICNVFSEKLKTIGKSRIESEAFIKSMKEMIIQRQMYVLSVYRNFDPIGDLVRNSLKKNAITFTEETVSSVLQEYADASAATSKFIRVGSDTLIYWQTCHGSHVNDKSKELSARFRAVKAMWNDDTFKSRPEAKKIYFVGDGEWRKEDFAMFMRSGVDGIFYPDQMDILVQTLVRQEVPPAAASG